MHTVRQKTMEGEITCPRSHLEALAEAIYATGRPVVEEAYSAFEEDLRRFAAPSDLLADIDRRFSSRGRFAHYVIHYPEAKGAVRRKKIDLIPEKCGGKKFRYSVEGWGLIPLQLSLEQTGQVQCRIAVNSEKRAMAWFPTYPEHGDPRRWDWMIVEREVRRLVRILKKSPNQPPEPTSGLAPGRGSS